MKISIRSKKQNRNKDEIIEYLFNNYSALFKGICMRYLKNERDADDVLQESFIKIHKNLNQLRDENSIVPWAKRIIINTAITFIKKQQINEKDEIRIEDLSRDISIEDEGESKELLKDLEMPELIGLMGLLPDGYRAILNLYAIEGYSHKQIAELLNIKEASSRSQYFKAKRAFCEILTNKY